MGSTNKVSTLEENLYALISKHFYPGAYQFGDDDLRIFKDASKLGYISDCRPLDEIDYDRYLNWKLCDIRADIGLESDLILAYYRIEQKRHPTDRSSRRLLL
jgi:hypothetical protein